ncbi:MAG: rod-binding protein [Lachnospiraceae bacterium]|nr:rod-binding protein [Lachnospiraceae bacterium]
MDIGSIGSDYLNSLNSITRAQGSSATELENKLKNKDVNSSSDEELMEVCKEFEAYFIEQVFKEMKKSVNITQSTDQATSQLMDYYSDNLTKEYAKSAADQEENGLAKMLYEQMKRNIGEQ